MKVHCKSFGLGIVAVTALAILSACPLPYEYNGPGAGNSNPSDPSSPKMTAPVTVSYSAQGGTSGTIEDGGTFYSGQTTTVTLSTATTNAVIFYTDSGTDLSLASLGSAKKIDGSTGNITISRATSFQCLDICAIAIGPNMLPSACVSATVGVSPYPILSITVDKATVSEDTPDNEAIFTIASSTAAPASGITVSLKTSGGYDSSHVTFPEPSGSTFTAIIPPSATTTTLSVIGVHNKDDVGQAVTLAIQPDPPGEATTYSVGAPASASVTIQDDGGHAVIYDSNGAGSGAPVDSNSYPSGKQVTTLGNTGNMAKSGYVFAGWTTNPNTTGTSASYATGAKWTMGSGDVTLYAVWIPSNLSFACSGNVIAISGYSTAPVGPLVIPPGVTAIGGFTFCATVTSVSLPSSVLSVAPYSFQSCSALTGVTFSPGVTSIGSFAFAYTGLTGSITIPWTVTAIGGVAFAFCDLSSILVDPSNTSYMSLSGVLFDKSQSTLVQAPCAMTGSYVIPSSVTSIGWAAFGGCSRLSSVTIPSSVISIGNSAFWYCTGLTSITIPLGVTTIQDDAFGGCSRLSSITIPSSVASIGASPFIWCSGLTSILVDSSNPTYASASGVLCDKAQTKLIEAPGAITSYSIPSSVTTIGYAAFLGCGLTSIIIPTNVASIEASAFGSCNNLVSVIMQAVTPPSLPASSSAFSNEATGFAIHVPSTAAVDAYTPTTGWSDYAGVIVTP